jgi:ubiquinone/menaquinone biosynthesis C-methylase UbiE
LIATPEKQTAEFVPAAGVAGLTKAYDAVVAVTGRETKMRTGLFDAVQSAVGAIEAPRIVELGCGTGSVAIPLAKRLPHAAVIGVDIDRQALAIAQSKRGSDLVTWAQGTAFDPPDIVDGADAVVISLVLHHLRPSDQPRALAAARAALNPGGTIHVIDWGIPRGPLPRAGFPLLQRIDGKENTDPLGKGLLPELLEGAKFSDVRMLHRFGTVWGSVEQYCAARPA